MLEVKSAGEKDAGEKIIVIGVGGGGNNAINRMVDEGFMEDVDLIAINTDRQDLDNCKASTTITIGEKVAKKHGAGGDPEKGKGAAEECEEQITNAIKDADMVFVTCGMGGGTGTGAAPVVAEISKKLGILTVGVVTKPFFMEGRKRMQRALEGIENLRQFVDSLIVIPNDKVLEIIERRVEPEEAFSMVDGVLHQSVRGVTDVIRYNGKINVDFADICAVMRDKGRAHVGIGTASGENKCREAVEAAINSPLLETKIDGAQYIMINFRGSKMSMLDLNDAVSYVTNNLASEDCDVFWGVIEEKSAEGDREDKITVTVIASGLPEDGVGVGVGTQSVQGVAQGQGTGFGRQASVRSNVAIRPGQMSSMGAPGSYGQQGTQGLRSVTPDISAQSQQIPQVQEVKTRQPQTPQPAAGSNSGGWDKDLKVPSFVKKYNSVFKK